MVTKPIINTEKEHRLVKEALQQDLEDKDQKINKLEIKNIELNNKVNSLLANNLKLQEHQTQNEQTSNFIDQNAEHLEQDYKSPSFQFHVTDSQSQRFLRGKEDENHPEFDQRRFLVGFDSRSRRLTAPGPARSEKMVNAKWFRDPSQGDLRSEQLYSVQNYKDSYFKGLIGVYSKINHKNKNL